jgi:hypothetical protein
MYIQGCKKSNNVWYKYATIVDLNFICDTIQIKRRSHTESPAGYIDKKLTTLLYQFKFPISCLLTGSGDGISNLEVL